MINVSKNRVVGILIGISLLLSIFIGCSDNKNKPVARVGGRDILADDFINVFSRGKSKADLGNVGLEDKINSLNKLIDNELKIVEAYRKNLDKDELILKNIEKRTETIIRQKLVDLEVVNVVIPESKIKEIFNKSQKRVTIFDLFLRLEPTPSKEHIENVEKKIQIIQKEIKKGVAFQTLVEKYSDEFKENDAKKSSLKVLRWSAVNSVKPLYKKVFSMNLNKISDPIKSSDGYHIIKVNTIDEVDRKRYSLEKQKIKNDLMRVMAKELRETYFKFIEKLKSKYHSKIVDENIEKFLDILHDTSKGDIKASSYNNQLYTKFTEEELDLAVVNYDEGEIKIKKMLKKIIESSRRRQPVLRNKIDVEAFLNKVIIVDDVLLFEARKRNLRKNKDVIEKLTKFLENAMYKKIVEISVNKKIEISEDDKKRYYEENRERFKNQEKRKVQEILITDKKLADRIAGRAKSRESFAKLAIKYNERVSTKKKNGVRGFIPRTMPSIGSAAFSTGINGIVGPVKNGNKYSIIKVLEIKKADYKTYEESLRYISTGIKRELKKKKEKEWLEQLRNEIDIIIFENRLENIFSEYRVKE